MDTDLLAYIAGFFDADGSVGVYSTNCKTSLRGIHLALKATITQKKKMSLFDVLLENFGGSLQHRHGKSREWQWVVSTQGALYFLETICPYLRVKNDQVILAIEFQKRMCKRGKAHLSDSEFEWQKEVSKRLKELKQ